MQWLHLKKSALAHDSKLFFIFFQRRLDAQIELCKLLQTNVQSHVRFLFIKKSHIINWIWPARYIWFILFIYFTCLCLIRKYFKHLFHSAKGSHHERKVQFFWTYEINMVYISLYLSFNSSQEFDYKRTFGSVFSVYNDEYN